MLSDRSLGKALLRGSTQQLTLRQRPTAKQWVELGDSYERRGERIAASKGIGIGTPQEGQQSQLTLRALRD